MEGKGSAIGDSMIPRLWLALIIGVPAGAGSGNLLIGLALFSVVIIALSVGPISCRKRRNYS